MALRADGYRRKSDGPDFFMVRQDIIHDETIARLPKAERWEFLSLAAGMRKSGSEDYRLRAPVAVFKGLLGRSRRDLLVKTLASWQEVSLISFIDDGEVFEISVCNPSDLFRMTTPERPESVVTETETETETNTEGRRLPREKTNGVEANPPMEGGNGDGGQKPSPQSRCSAPELLAEPDMKTARERAEFEKKDFEISDSEMHAAWKRFAASSEVTMTPENWVNQFGIWLSGNWPLEEIDASHAAHDGIERNGHD